MNIICHDFLIIDDNLMLTKTLLQWLRRKWPQITIDIVHTILSAKEKIAQYHYKIFLIDINLPDGNGAELLPILPETSIKLGMSGNIIDGKIQNRFTRFLEKPFRFEDLNPFLSDLNSIKDLHNMINY